MNHEINSASCQSHTFYEICKIISVWTMQNCVSLNSNTGEWPETLKKQMYKFHVWKIQRNRIYGTKNINELTIFRENICQNPIKSFKGCDALGLAEIGIYFKCIIIVFRNSRLQEPCVQSTVVPWSRIMVSVQLSQLLMSLDMCK